ncbi:MAG: PQQ-binding-like beta-propeller repeat protein [Gemmataceae bacterium]
MTVTNRPKRLWMPLVGTLVITIACLTYYYGFGANEDRGRRALSVWFALGAFALWNLVWLAFFSGMTWRRRLMVTALVLVALAAGRRGTIRNIHFDGDMAGPVITWRWQPLQADVIQAHRQSQGGGNVAVSMNLDASDFPEYRGVRRDGVVTGPELRRDWSKPPRILWKQPCGEGYAGFAVVDELAVTIEQRGDDEAVVAYQTSTGRELWQHRYPTRFSEALGGDGPRATPTVHDGNVYALGAAGRLTCLDARTGKLIWAADILADNENIPWGMSGSPLVDDKLVIVNPGSQRESAKGRALVAYDRLTGKEVWHGGDTQAGYSSPMFAMLGGMRQVILFDADVVAGYDPSNGQKLWSFKYPSYQGINVAQPLVLSDDRVLISAGYNYGSAMINVKRDAKKWSAEQLWKSNRLRCKFTSPVEFEGHVYGLDDGILVCLDAQTGSQKWKGERYGHGQLLREGNTLVIFAETGFLAEVEASPEKYHELGRVRVFDETKNWNPFALARGRAYQRNHREMACVDMGGQ